MTVGASCIVMEEPARPITGPAKEEETIEAVDSMMALCGKLPGPFVCTFHAVHCECHVPRARASTRPKTQNGQLYIACDRVEEDTTHEVVWEMGVLLN